MSKKTLNDINIQTYDSFFGFDDTTINKTNDVDGSNKIIEIDINLISDFPNHPFRVIDNNDEMVQLVDSVQNNGVLVPVIVRPNSENNGYQMISGHRRKLASQLAEFKKIPSIITDLTDDQATIVMVDSNIQRENLLISEKAYAYKMKYEALTNQGRRSDLATSSQVGTKYQTKRADQTLAEQLGISRNTVQRYIRLTNLIQPLMELVDNKRMAFNPAYELSFITKGNQEMLYNAINEINATPSLSQSKQIRKLDEMNLLSNESITNILIIEKPNQKEKLVIPNDKLKKYFKRGTTPKQMEETIIKLLKQWTKKQEKNQER